MKASTSLHARAEQYLVERRRLGFSLRAPACSLRGFVRHIQVVGHRGPLTIEVMTDWARRDSHGSDDPHTWARRLKHLRSFTRWLRQFEPLTEIPDHTIFGRIPERQAPHIYSEPEIVDLLAAARRLGPASTLRAESSSRRCSVLLPAVDCASARRWRCATRTSTSGAGC